ncbi:MAG: beta-galactosidase [Halocynthiibacter sp.]
MKPTVGVCYYPEHWPEETRAEDAAQMAAIGLSWVRIGEFAWSRLEPRPGHFDWEWMDRAIETLGAAGLKVVLGTPTATPPRWMLHKWPDMLAVGADGNSRKFGSRRHYCFSHQGYRDECARITRLLAQRYGRNPTVQAWQTDNEYGCHDTTLSYSQSALVGFRDWLAQKYQSPQKLNTAWGNVFWSMEYSEFDEIELPNLTVTNPNPSHALDFRRYSSEQVVDFNRIQTDILRQFTDAPLVHNFMARTTDFDHFKVGADLDIASWDSYPLGFLEDRSDQSDEWIRRFMRQGDPDFQAFHHDLYRAVGRGRWWVMEQQPGPVNWAPYNPAPLPGMARFWAWEAYAHGAETVCYFRWRQAPFAQEQMHAGLLRPDGAPGAGLAQARQGAEELKTIGDIDQQAADVALVFDYESAWGWEIQPQGRDFDYFRLVFDFYRALRKLGLSVDIVDPQIRDLNAYGLVLMPGLMTLGDNLRHAVESFSGTMIAGPRTGSKTSSMQIPPDMPPQIPGLECTVEYVESLRPGVKIPLTNGGAFKIWSECVTSSGKIVETTKAGLPAMVACGKLNYLAGWPDQKALVRLIETACKEAGIATTSLPEGVRIRDARGLRFVFNYNAEPQTFDGIELPAAGVHWTRR